VSDLAWPLITIYSHPFEADLVDQPFLLATVKCFRSLLESIVCISHGVTPTPQL